MGVYKDFLAKNENAGENIKRIIEKEHKATTALIEKDRQAGGIKNIYLPGQDKMMTKEEVQSIPVYLREQNVAEYQADIKNKLKNNAAGIKTSKPPRYGVPRNQMSEEDYQKKIADMQSSKGTYLLNNFVLGAGEQMDGIVKAPAALADVITGGKTDWDDQDPRINPISGLDVMSRAVQEVNENGAPLPRIAGDLARMAGQQTVQVGFSAGVGPQVNAGLMGASVFGNEYAANREEGMSVLQSATNAGLKGASEAGLEYLLGIGGRGARKLTKNIAKNPTVQKIAGSYFGKVAEGFAGEFAEESSQEPIGMLIDKVTGKEVTADDVKNLPKNMLYSGLIGGISGGTMKGVTRLPSLGSDIQNALREKTAADKTKAASQTRIAQVPSSNAQSASANTAFDNIISQVDEKNNTQKQERPHFRMRRTFDDTLDEEQRRVFSDVAKSGDKYNATTVAQTDEQAKAQEIAAKFGRRVVFYEGSDNGFISGDSVYINKNAQNPVMAVAGHELTHRIMNDAKTKSELLDYIKSQAINETGNTKLKGGFADKFNEKKRLYESRLENVADDMIWEEIAADIGGDLFMNDEFINRITAEKPSLAMRIRNFIVDIINRLRGKGRYQDVSGSTIEYMRDMAKVAQKYERAFAKARENTGSQTTEVKYQAIERDGSGSAYVRIDNNVLDGVPREQWAKKVTEWINKNIQGNIFTAYSDNEIIKANRRLTNEYAHGADSKRTYGDAYDAKMNVAGNLDEAIRISQKVDSAMDKTNPDGTLKHGNFAKLGWDYRDFNFEYAGKMYSGKLNVAKNENGKVAYDVTNIKEVATSVGKSLKSEDTRIESATSINNSIPQNGEKVKESNENVKRSLSEDEKNPVSRFRTNTIERAEIFTPEDLEAISPTEFEYIPESDKQWDEQAVKNVQADMRGVMEKIRNADAMTSGTMSHEAAIISKILTDRYHQTGSISSFAELDDWLKTVAERTRETARALKATDTAWKKSPAAAVAKAQKVVRDSQEKMENPKSKKARERREEANGIDKGLSGIEKTGLDKIAEGNEFGEAIKEYYENGERDISLYEFLLQQGVQNEDMEQFAKNIADMYDDFVKNKKKDYLKGVIKDDGRLKLTDQQTIDRLNERIANIFNNNKDRQAEYENRVLKRINPLLAREIKARGIDLTGIVKRGATATEEANRDFVKQLFADLNGRITEQDLKDLQEAAYREFARLAEVRRDNLINKYFHIDGDGNIITRSVVPKTRFSKIIELINLGAYGRSGVIEEMLKADDGLPTLSQNDINSILNLMQQAEILDENDREYKVKIAKVKKIIESKLPTSKAAAVRAYARINMLLNPKTILTRNAGSNLIQSGVYNVENVIGAGIDKALSKDTNFRTAAMPGLRKQGEGAMKGISEAIEDYRNNVDTRGFDGKYDIGEGQPFQGNNAVSKVLDKLNRFTGFLLDAGDRPFYEAYFADVLNQQMKANGVTQPTEDMIAVADMVALERTWQDNNVYTGLFNGAKKFLNGVPLLNSKMIPPQIRKILNDRGIKVNQNGETTYYGLGDIIMPFVKTPANLLRSTIQYSPPGLAKAIIYDLGEFKSAVKDGTVTPQQQRQLVDNLSKGIVGTLVMLGGMALAGAGLYTGEDEEDERASAFKQYVEGIMPNSLKIGDTSLSLSWLQPLGGTLSFGATLADELKKDNSMTEKAWNSFANSLENLVNASLLQGVREFFSSEYTSMADKGIAVVQDAGLQMLPLGSLTKQAANAFDNTTRSTYATDEKGKYLNRIKQYYPYFSNTLEPRLNALGEETQRTYDSTPEKTSLADGARRALTSFFNPANTRHINSTPIIDELNRVYDMTGDSGVYPAEVDKKVTVGGKEMRLTEGQYTTYQRKVGQKFKETLNALIVDDEVASEYAGEKSDDVQVTYAQMTADERKNKETSIKSNITKSYKKDIGKEGVDVKDLSATEKQELKRLQNEAVKRFRSGEAQTVKVVWSDVPYSQLDDAQKAEVLSSALKREKDAVNEELAKDWEKNASPVFKMGG